jgi:hypothetical protein
LWLELTRQQEPILGWRLFFAWCFNELTSKPDVHPKIYTSPCRSLSPPILRKVSLRYFEAKRQSKVVLIVETRETRQIRNSHKKAQDAQKLATNAAIRKQILVRFIRAICG